MRSTLPRKARCSPWLVPQLVSGVCFDPPDCYSPVGYLYNVPDHAYREATLFVEEGTLRPAGIGQLAAYLKSKGIGKVTVVAL